MSTKKKTTKKKKLELPAIHTCEYVELTDVRGHDLDDYWELVVEDAPFSWGDNNRSMVTASSLRYHLEDRLCDYQNKKAVKRVIAVLAALGETYVDLES